MNDILIIAKQNNFDVFSCLEIQHNKNFLQDLKFVKGNAVFYAAIISEILVIVIYRIDIISFLWLNVIGALLVIILSVILQLLLKIKTPQ